MVKIIYISSKSLPHYFYRVTKMGCTTTGRIVRDAVAERRRLIPHASICGAVGITFFPVTVVGVQWRFFYVFR